MPRRTVDSEGLLLNLLKLVKMILNLNLSKEKELGIKQVRLLAGCWPSLQKPWYGMAPAAEPE